VAGGDAFEKDQAGGRGAVMVVEALGGGLSFWSGETTRALVTGLFQI
jgi:hypothetical protein